MSTVDTPDIDDDDIEDGQSLESPDFVTRVLISGEAGYLELEGLFELEIDNWMWEINFVRDPDDRAGVSDVDAVLLEDAAGKRAFAMTEEGVEAYGQVMGVLEDDDGDRLTLNVSVPTGGSVE